MTPSQLAQKLTIEADKTRGFFQQISPTDWGKQLYADGNEWTIKEVLAHIVHAEEDLLRMYQNIVAGGAGVAEDFDLNETNHQHVAALLENSTSDLLNIFTQNRKHTVTWVSALKDADLAKEGRHPFMGIITIKEMIKLIYRHVQIHQRDIRKMLKGL